MIAIHHNRYGICKNCGDLIVLEIRETVGGEMHFCSSKLTATAASVVSFEEKEIKITKAENNFIKEIKNRSKPRWMK